MLGVQQSYTFVIHRKRMFSFFRRVHVEQRSRTTSAKHRDRRVFTYPVYNDELTLRLRWRLLTSRNALSVNFWVSNTRDGAYHSPRIRLSKRSPSFSLASPPARPLRASLVSTDSRVANWLLIMLDPKVSAKNTRLITWKYTDRYVLPCA